MVDLNGFKWLKHRSKEVDLSNDKRSLLTKRSKPFQAVRRGNLPISIWFKQLGKFAFELKLLAQTFNWKI